jgi:hypothetical protein
MAVLTIGVVTIGCVAHGRTVGAPESITWRSSNAIE